MTHVYQYNSDQRSSLAHLLIDFPALNNLKQYNNVTNNTNKILDLVLSNMAGATIKAADNPLVNVDP